VRRPVLIVLLVVVAIGLAGCGKSSKVTTPTPSAIVGPVPKPPAAVKGNAAAGKAVFAANGCSACHTFTPAGATGKVGPDLDNLAEYAKTAGQPLDDFIHESIVSPDAYIAPGFTKGIMPGTYGSTLSAQQLADLVAFLAQSS
jgi:cytochrome c2